MDKSHDNVYPFNKTHIQEMTLDLARKTSYKLARYDVQTDDVLAKK